MKVTLPPELERFVAEQIKSGAYRSADDLFVQSLGMLQAQEEFIRSNVMELRESIEKGAREIRDGNVLDGKTAIDNIRKKLLERERGGQ